MTTSDETTFAGKNGRIASGVVLQTGLTTPVCPATSQTYGEHSYDAYIYGGIELQTQKPFIQFDPPYTIQIYDDILPITGLKRITLSMKFTALDVTLRITNSESGAELFSQTRNYPNGWGGQGSHTGSFVYYGATPSTGGSLLVRDFLSTRP